MAWTEVGAARRDRFSRWGVFWRQWAVADEFGGRGTKEETDSREKPDFLGSGDLAVSEFIRGPDWSQ